MDLTEQERKVTQIIRESRSAWVLKVTLDPEAVEALCQKALAVEWNTPEGEMVTLTPYGAAVLGFDMVERYKFGTMRKRPNQPKVRAYTEIPRWIEERALDPDVTKRKKGQKPKYAEPGLPIMDEPEPRRQVAIDAVTGEQLAIRFGMKQGIPVTVDQRMAKGESSKPKKRKRGRKVG